MTHWLVIGFSSILVAILLFRIYQTVSTECLTAIIVIIMLVFTICKIIAEKAIHADYKELIELYKEIDKKKQTQIEEWRELYKDLLEKCKNNL